MNKTSIIATLATITALSTSTFAYDGRINVSSTPGAVVTTPVGGGPFTVSIDTGFARSATLEQMRLLQNPFLGFCLEYNEHITLSGNQDYYVNVANQAINGGGGPNPDPLSMVTAYMYSQYRAGNIATTAQGAADLQNAIWWMEEEITTSQRSSAAATMISNAKTALGLTALSDTALRALNANGAYGVRALNVYSNATLTAMNQDVLAMVPEPSTYAAAALLMVPVLVQARRMRRSA
jgi:hypothetical protein